MDIGILLAVAGPEEHGSHRRGATTVLAVLTDDCSGVPGAAHRLGSYRQMTWSPGRGRNLGAVGDDGDGAVARVMMKLVGEEMIRAVVSAKFSAT